MIPRLYVTEHLQKSARFTADERAAHYLLNVLRRGSGDPLLLFNGRDGEYRARIAEAAKRRLVLEALEQTRAQETEPDLWLCFAPLKKDAVDFLVEKGTELGVTRFQPVLTAHSASNRINQTRLTAVATEAAEQSERLTVPEVLEPISLEALRTGWSKDRHLLICAEAGAAKPMARALNDLTSDVRLSNQFAVLIGPEGGFQEDELDRLKKLPFVTAVGLGPRILRAETAALAALAVFQAILGDGEKRPPRSSGAGS
jgi:16S rRNA (uracil1498-N3)-methyltransferase